MKTLKVASNCICLVAMLNFLPTAPISSVANPYPAHLPGLHLVAIVDFLLRTAPIFDAANPYLAHLPALHLVAPTEGPIAPRNCHTRRIL